jgi:hypothetical protein
MISVRRGRHIDCLPLATPVRVKAMVGPFLLCIPYLIRSYRVESLVSLSAFDLIRLRKVGHLHISEQKKTSPPSRQRLLWTPLQRTINVGICVLDACIKAPTCHMLNGGCGNEWFQSKLEERRILYLVKVGCMRQMEGTYAVSHMITLFILCRLSD